MQTIITFIISAMCLATLAGCGKINTVSTQLPAEKPAVQAMFIDVDADEISTAPMLKVNGHLFYDSGEISSEARCGMMDGKIETSVHETQIPGRDDESNFGEGYGYQYGINDTIEVLIDGEWHIFKAD